MDLNNQRRSSTFLRYLFPLAGCLLITGLLGVRSLGNLSVNAAIFIPLYLLLFLPYLGGIYAIHRQPRQIRFLLIMAFAVVFRLILLPGDPTLSDDIYRYVHDGKVQGQGINPYKHPPSDIPGHDPRINNPGIRTIYPPFMQILFFLVTRVSESVLAMKAFMVLCDLGLCLALSRLLRARGIPEANVLYYAWNPLILVETASSGHNDVVALFFLFIALLLFQSNRGLGGHVFSGLSILSKSFTAPLWPVFLRRHHRWTFLACPLLILALSLPYYLGGDMFEGLRTYGENWHFNDSLFALLKSSFLFGTKEKAWWPAGLLFLGGYIYILWREKDDIFACASIFGLSLMLAPTVHPWYVTWVVPFLALRPRASWMLLTALVILAYHVRIGWELRGEWVESTGIKWLEYGPFYAVWIAEWFVLRRKSFSLRNDKPLDNT